MKSLNQPLAVGLVSAALGCFTPAWAQEAESLPLEFDGDRSQVTQTNDPLEALGMNIYGFVQLDTFWNSDKVDPNWSDVVRPSTIATGNNSTEYGKGSEFGMSVRSTTIGMKGEFDAGSSPLKTWFEFDLTETGTKAGETGLHLRHAWGEWGSWGAGQTHTVFMDIAIFPNTLQYWGPPGMVFNRNPQLRYTWFGENSHTALAIEQQNAGLDGDSVAEIDPDLGANISSNSSLPDLTAHYKQAHDWGHWQVGGVLRKLEYETLNAPGNDPSGSETGWGLNLSSAFKAGEKDTLKLQYVFGAGIASYMNDGGSNLAPDSGGDNAVELQGLSAYLDHDWNETLTSSVGYSFNDVDNTDLQSADAFSKGSYATANIMHRPNKHITYAFELYWAEREDNNGEDGDLVRLQFTIKWDFSLGAFSPAFDT